MARYRFFATLRGRPKNEVRIAGTEETGLEVHIRGWNTGVYVRLHVSHVFGERDHVYIKRTGGSNSANSNKVETVASWHEGDATVQFTPTGETYHATPGV